MENDFIKLYNNWELEESINIDYIKYKRLELVLYMFYFTISYIYIYNLHYNNIIYIYKLKFYTRNRSKIKNK